LKWFDKKTGIVDKKYIRNKSVKNKLYSITETSINMKFFVKDAAGIFKILIGVLGLFLILFGIHWIAILFGVALGVIYFAIPKGI